MKKARKITRRQNYYKKLNHLKIDNMLIPIPNYIIEIITKNIDINQVFDISNGIFTFKKGISEEKINNTLDYIAFIMTSFTHDIIDASQKESSEEEWNKKFREGLQQRINLAGFLMKNKEYEKSRELYLKYIEEIAKIHEETSIDDTVKLQKKPTKR